MTTPAHKIKLYTNHGCPWAHRAHIALAELNVPFGEEIVDLSVPRTREYLQVNPRGLVPAMEFDGQVITESGIVAAFLADAYPSAGLSPPSTDPDGPLARARVAFFVDTYFSKGLGHVLKSVSAWGMDPPPRSRPQPTSLPSSSRRSSPCSRTRRRSLGEQQADFSRGSFLLRLYAYIKHGLMPASLGEDLAAKAPNFDKWAKATIAHPSVTCVWDEDRVIAHSKYRYGKK
ncbi:glutathione s-transferase [Apiospora arundinis]